MLPEMPVGVKGDLGNCFLGEIGQNAIKILSVPLPGRPPEGGGEVQPKARYSLRKTQSVNPLA